MIEKLRWWQCSICAEKIGEGSMKCTKDRKYYCKNCVNKHIKTCPYPHIKFVYHGHYRTKEKPLDTELKAEEF
jgi:hypothetical protein